MSGQVRQHLRQGHRGLALESAGFLYDDFALLGPAALAVQAVRCLDPHRFLAGFDGGRVARNVTDDAVLVGFLDQGLVRLGSSEFANSAKACEKVASLGPVQGFASRTAAATACLPGTGRSSAFLSCSMGDVVPGV